MQNTGVNGGGGGGGRVRAEDVISKLKDDGDFDRLRLKIIRKIKDNEDLRSNIISMVKQSAALNRPGAENMKPRQLSDAIHQEIGDKLLGQVSDGLWNIIRSADGMKNEITETVQSVYEKLSNPQGKDNASSSSHKDSLANRNGLNKNGDTIRTMETDGTLSDGELNEPPGFGLTDVHWRNKNNQVNQPSSSSIPIPHEGQTVAEMQGDKIHLKAFPEPKKLDHGTPPGFSSVLKHKKSGDASDEDPDVPPGFG